MARRQLLTDEQWTRLLAPPSDEREIVRYWTLSREDFDIIFRKRSDDPSRHECEGLKGWAQLIVKATNQAQIDHPLFDLGGFG